MVGFFNRAVRAWQSARYLFAVAPCHRMPRHGIFILALSIPPTFALQCL